MCVWGGAKEATPPPQRPCPYPLPPETRRGVQRRCPLSGGGCALPAPGSDARRLRRPGGASRSVGVREGRRPLGDWQAGRGQERPSARRVAARLPRAGAAGRGARRRGGGGGGGGGGGRCGRLRARGGLGSAAAALSRSAAGVAVAAAPSPRSRRKEAAGGEQHRVPGGDPEGAPRAASVSGAPSRGLAAAAPKGGERGPGLAAHQEAGALRGEGRLRRAAPGPAPGAVPRGPALSRGACRVRAGGPGSAGPRRASPLGLAGSSGERWLWFFFFFFPFRGWWQRGEQF